MKLINTLIAGLILATGFSVNATAASHGAARVTKSETQSNTAAPLTDGEVKKVDKATGKITIKHGPLVNLDMPAMTMVFRVKAPAMLDQVRAGDKIGFVAEKVDGKITVTKVEVKK